MANTEKKIRITKTMKFEAIKAMLTGNPVPHEISLDMALEFIDKEVLQLANKNKSDTKKLTATQIANEKFKEQILEFLAQPHENPKGVTCTDCVKAIPALENNQKASALMRQLKNAGLVTDTEEKGKRLFSLIED